MTGPGWTAEEDAVIAEYYPTEGGEGCAERLMRTPSACAARARRIGVRSTKIRGRSRPWTDEEERAITRHLVAACRETGRSPMAVIRHQEWLLRKATGTRR